MGYRGVRDRAASRVYTGMVPPYYDEILIEYPTPTLERFSYTMIDTREEGASPILVGVIEVEYAAADKVNIIRVTKTFEAEGLV